MFKSLPHFTVCLWLLFLQHSSAQTENSLQGFGVETNYFTGKVIKHTVNFHLPIPRSSTGIDINFQWKTYGRHEWEQRRRYPIVGIGFAYTDYGIDSVYGRCFSLYPNITIPLITSKKIEWTLRIGDGFAYVTKTYSRKPYLDTINNAIGSHINDYGSFMTDLRYRINNHWDVQVGANFTHISDASYHQPNLGINLAGVHVGIRYFPITSEPKRIVRTLKPLKNRWLFQARTTIAFNENVAPSGPLYPIYITSAYLTKRWINKNKAFGGIDYSYHNNIYYFLRDNSGIVTPGSEASHSYKMAVFAGNEFLLGRVGVILQVGWYIKQAYQQQGLYYEKIGGTFYLIKKEKGPLKEFFLCAFLKTHLTVAELAEFGCGISF